MNNAQKIYNFLSSKFIKVENNNKSVEYKNINDINFNDENYITNINLEHEILRDKSGRANQITYDFIPYDYSNYTNEINGVLYKIIQNSIENKNNNIKSIRLIMNDNDKNIMSITDIQNYVYSGYANFNKNMKKSLFKILSSYEADGLKLFPIKLEIFNIEFNKSGGCNSTDQNKIVFEYIPKLANYFNLPDNNLVKFKIINYKSKNNNCGLVCLIRASGNKANQIKPDMIRKEFNILLNTMISVDQIQKIGMIKFGVKVHVFNQYEYLISDDNNNDNDETKEEIFLLLKDEHYYIIDTNNYKKYRKCEICNKT